MDGMTGNDISHVVDADRAHVWHHLIQHKPFETNDPRIIVEGKGMRVWDQKGKEHLDGVSGGVWTVNVGYGRERIAKAVADQLTKMCFFGGMAGCAMIGQSGINVRSGGRTRLSTLIAGVVLLLMAVFLSDWVGQIPMAALVAVMIMVSIGTFSWDSLRNLKHYPLSTNIVMVVTVVVVVFTHNLAYGVLAGVLLVFQANRTTYQMQTGCGPLYVTINEDQAGVFELFTTMGKAGGCASSQCEAIGRLVSLAWRSGIQARQAVKQMIGITCHKPAGFGDNRITSCADAVAKAIQMHMADHEDVDLAHANNGGACPDCGGPVEHEGGCCVCHVCGFSECA